MRTRRWISRAASGGELLPVAKRHAGSFAGAAGRGNLRSDDGHRRCLRRPGCSARCSSIMNPEAKLAELGLTLPSRPASYAMPVDAHGQPPLLRRHDRRLQWPADARRPGRQRADRQRPPKKAAEVCVLNTLANIKAAVGSLDRVARIVMVSGFVNAVDGFSDSPAVIKRRERPAREGLRRGRQTPTPPSRPTACRAGRRSRWRWWRR